MIARPNRPAVMLLGGLSLEQYAGVTAALAEQFDLSQILDQEGIDPSAWPAASRAWSRAIVEATNLQILLTEKRRIAEDCLARSLVQGCCRPLATTGR